MAKLSRANWLGNRYKRQRDGTWREAPSGKVFSSASSPTPIRREPRYGHVYGGDIAAKGGRKGLVFNEKKKKFIRLG